MIAILDILIEILYFLNKKANMIKKIAQFLKDYYIFLKFGISGCSAMATDLFFLYTFHDIFKFKLYLSVLMAYSISFVVSFLLQKFWTFKNNEKNKTQRQFFMYVGVGVSGVIFNSLMVQLLVSKYGVYYLFAQLFIAGFIGVVNFLVYRFVIFREKRYWKKNMKNILIATGIFPPDHGGPASYVNILSKELPKMGYKLRIVTYSDLTPKKCKKVKNKGFILYKISRQQGIFMRYFLYFKKIWRHLYWADAVYIQGPVSEGLPAFIACYLKRRKYMLKVVGDYAWEQGSRRYNVNDTLDDFQGKNYSFEVEVMRYIQKTIARKAELVITPSYYLKKVVNAWGVDNKKIDVIYNTVNDCEDNYVKSEIKNKIGEDRDIILSMGRLVPWKGFDTLIQTMPEILKINSNFKLIIVGDGSERDRLEKIVSDLKLEKHVEIKHGMSQTDFFDYMRSSDMFILNTKYEGLSHVIIEAMKLGIPVATTNVCGNPELIANNMNGILFEYNNKNEIIESVRKLSRNQDMVIKYTLESKKNVKEMFSKENMLKRISKSFKHVYK